MTSRGWLAAERLGPSPEKERMSVAKTLSLLVGQRSVAGCAQRSNGDRALVFEPTDPQQVEAKGWLLALADGSGEDAAGTAAEEALRKLSEEYYAGTTGVRGSLDAAVRAANVVVRDLALSKPFWSDVGATLVGAVVCGDQLLVANVGNCRAYLVRGGGIRAITRDHTWVADEIRAQRLTPGQARTHPRRDVLTRGLGVRADVRADIFAETLQPDDVLLLCSDGLYDVLSDDELRETVTSQGPVEAAEKLVSLAAERGASDDASAVVLGPARAGQLRGRAPRRRLLPLAGVTVALLAAGTFGYAVLAGAQPVATATAQSVILTSATPTSPAPPTATDTPTARATSTPTATSTLAPTATATATATPPPASPTAAPSPVAASPTAVPSPVEPTKPPATPTPSPRPTNTRVPPTATPPPTQTPTPRPPTATPPPVAVSPSLHPAVVESGSVLLSWSYAGQLAADEAFDVRVWRLGAPSLGIANTRDTAYRIGGGFPSGDYLWTVAVVRRQGGAVSELASASSTGQFVWVGSAGSGGSGGTSDDAPIGR